jgi:hypothetical protein
MKKEDGIHCFSFPVRSLAFFLLARSAIARVRRCGGKEREGNGEGSSRRGAQERWTDTKEGNANSSQQKQ